MNTNDRPSSSKPLSPTAAFIYASPSDAQYIANSIDAIVTCVNTLPTELLVGPPIPRGGAISPRYLRSMFSEARPIVTKASSLSFDPIMPSSYDASQRYESWKSMVQQPLRATRQRPGKRVDFFVQGLLLGSSIVSITLLLGFAVFGNFVFKKLWLARV